MEPEWGVILAKSLLAAIALLKFLERRKQK
jgi:hypothetical protein